MLSCWFSAVFFFFFFQAEDGIRDVAVTGVQTCALPICGSSIRSSSRTTSGETTARYCDSSCSHQRIVRSRRNGSPLSRYAPMTDVSRYALGFISRTFPERQRSSFSHRRSSPSAESLAEKRTRHESDAENCHREFRSVGTRPFH